MDEVESLRLRREYHRHFAASSDGRSEGRVADFLYVISPAVALRLLLVPERAAASLARDPGVAVDYPLAAVRPRSERDGLSHREEGDDSQQDGIMHGESAEGCHGA